MRCDQHPHAGGEESRAVLSAAHRVAGLELRQGSRVASRTGGAGRRFQAAVREPDASVLAGVKPAPRAPLHSTRSPLQLRPEEEETVETTRTPCCEWHLRMWLRAFDLVVRASFFGLVFVRFCSSGPCIACSHASVLTPFHAISRRTHASLLHPPLVPPRKTALCTLPLAYSLALCTRIQPLCTRTSSALHTLIRPLCTRPRAAFVHAHCAAVAHVLADPCASSARTHHCTPAAHAPSYSLCTLTPVYARCTHTSDSRGLLSATPRGSCTHLTIPLPNNPPLIRSPNHPSLGVMPIIVIPKTPPIFVITSIPPLPTRTLPPTSSSPLSAPCLFASSQTLPPHNRLRIPLFPSTRAPFPRTICAGPTSIPGQCPEP